MKIQRPAAEAIAVLLDKALEGLFVASPIPRAQLDAYSELLVPARARLFGMLAAIGAEYPDLDKTRHDDPEQPSGAEHVEDLPQMGDGGVGHMRLALEQSIALIAQAAAIIASGPHLSDASRRYFDEYGTEAREAIESALAYLETLST